MIDQDPGLYLVTCPDCQDTGFVTGTVLGIEMSLTVPCTTCHGLGRLWLTKEEADDD